MASGLNILLIDDDSTFHLVHERLLRSSGLARTINVAFNGSEGLDFMIAKRGAKNFPDLIFVDLDMPVMNGLEFLEAVNQIFTDERERLLIIVLSSSARPEDKFLAEQLGVDFYMVKPLRIDELRLALSSCDKVQNFG